jgi:hypothetical protein
MARFDLIKEYTPPAGAVLTFYAAGSAHDAADKLALFSDRDYLVPLANPITLGAEKQLAVYFVETTVDLHIEHAIYGAGGIWLLNQHFPNTDAAIAAQVAAEASAVATAADRVQTAADRVQTGLDGVATAADAIATAADREQTGLDVTAANAGAAAATGMGYPTRALMDAAAGLYTEGQVVRVTNDPTPANNGDWIKGVTVFTQSSFDRVAVVEQDVDGLDGRLTLIDTNVSMFSPQGISYPAFAVADEAGEFVFSVEADGGLKTDLLSVTGALQVGPAGWVETDMAKIMQVGDEFLWGVADEEGELLVGVDSEGRLVANFELASIPAAGIEPAAGLYDYDINHIFTYGQSLSVGQAMPIQTPSQNYDNLAFFRGQRPQYDYPEETPVEWYASLVPAIEFQSPNPSWPSLGETPSGGTGDMIKMLILAEDGKAFADHTYQLLLSAPGYGATTIAQLSRGGAYFSQLVEQAGYGLALANAAGKTYAAQAVTWTQGESDYLSSTSRAAYLASLNQLVADLQTDIKAVTGQNKSIPLISYQLASHKNASKTTPEIALAQMDAEEANPLIYIATPMYHLPYQDGWHLTGIGSRWLGAYYGLAYKRIVLDEQAWKPLKPIASVRQGNLVDLRFNVPSGKLVFDTSQVTENANKGFELVDAAGDPLTISSVAIVDTARVRIAAAAPVPSGAKIRYAWTGAGTVGPTDGPRGNLRDTQGDDIVFDPTGINKRMDNWCIIFEMEV